MQPMRVIRNTVFKIIFASRLISEICTLSYRETGSNGETFVVPAAPARKNLHGSHHSLHSSGSKGSRGSLSDVSQSDSNSELKRSPPGETVKSSIPDSSQRRGSGSSQSDRLVDWGSLRSLSICPV